MPNNLPPFAIDCKNKLIEGKPCLYDLTTQII
nr:MAG TPA: hypothetical protein [Caudoviricetes sp.]